MGTLCAPSNAIPLMAKFEGKHTYRYIKDVSLLYLRYIDDIFMSCNRERNKRTKN